LLLDEPSTGLDVRSTELLVEAIAAERARGAIVVLVTHDTALVERTANVRVRLARGRVERVEEAA
jgi:ABC-type Mn2+/Zn2+ transport system ATPase subunit